METTNETTDPRPVKAWVYDKGGKLIKTLTKDLGYWLERGTPGQAWAIVELDNGRQEIVYYTQLTH